MLPEKIWRTRGASLAWLPDSSGFYYTRYPRPGDVPPGEEVYHRHVFLHNLGQPANENGLKDLEVFGHVMNPEHWPSVKLSVRRPLAIGEGGTGLGPDRDVFERSEETGSWVCCGG